MADVTFKQRVQGSQGRQFMVQTTGFTFSASTTVYFGQIPRSPVGTGGLSKTYPRVSGTINKVSIYTYAATTPGSSDGAISVYVRVNNTTDYLVDTLSVSTAERIFFNASMNSGAGIPITETDYFEIKIVSGAYTTAPAGLGIAGTVFID